MGGGTAESHYNNAIKASIEDWFGVLSKVQADNPVANYLANPKVAYTTASGNYKQKI